MSIEIQNFLFWQKLYYHMRRCPQKGTESRKEKKKSYHVKLIVQFSEFFETRTKSLSIFVVEIWHFKVKNLQLQIFQYRQFKLKIE